MGYLKSYPYVVGVAANGHTVQLKNNPDAIADFILQAGKIFNITVLSPDGESLIGTKGTKIVSCVDSALYSAVSRSMAHA